jgi:hypothetical protein
VQHELFAIGDALHLGEVWLFYPRIYETVPVVTKDSEGSIKMKVHRCRLDIYSVKWRDVDLAG